MVPVVRADAMAAAAAAATPGVTRLCLSGLPTASRESINSLELRESMELRRSLGGGSDRRESRGSGAGGGWPCDAADGWPHWRVRNSSMVGRRLRRPLHSRLSLSSTVSVRPCVVRLDLLEEQLWAGTRPEGKAIAVARMEAAVEALEDSEVHGGGEKGTTLLTPGCNQLERRIRLQR